MTIERKDNLGNNPGVEVFYAVPALHTFSLTFTKFPQMTLCKMTVEIIPVNRIRAGERAHLWLLERGLFLIQEGKYHI